MGRRRSINIVMVSSIKITHTRIIVLSLVLGLAISIVTGYYHESETRPFPGVHGTTTITTPVGGFPVGYLHDRLGSSVQGSLDLLDVFNWTAFTMNSVFWIAVLYGGYMGYAYSKRGKRVGNRDRE